MKALDTGIRTILAGDTGAGGVATLSTGGIFQLTAPQGTIPPYLAFQELTNLPGYTFSQLAFDHFLYQVKAFAVDDPNGTFSGPAKSSDIMDRVRNLLTDPVSLNVTGKSVLYSRFKRSITAMTEFDQANNRWIYSKGAIVELWLA